MDNDPSNQLIRIGATWQMNDWENAMQCYSKQCQNIQKTIKVGLLHGRYRLASNRLLNHHRIESYSVQPQSHKTAEHLNKSSASETKIARYLWCMRFTTISHFRCWIAVSLLQTLNCCRIDRFAKPMTIQCARLKRWMSIDSFLVWKSNIANVG